MAYDCTLISWEYDTGYINSLLFFKIYRYDPNTDTANDTNTLSGTPTQTFRLIKTIRLLEATDTAAEFPTTATYAFIDENGTKPTKDPIKYKILAEHKDCGTSEWSVEILVP